jgi:hypothetical protein
MKFLQDCYMKHFGNVSLQYIIVFMSNSANFIGL